MNWANDGTAIFPEINCDCERSRSERARAPLDATAAPITSHVTQNNITTPFGRLARYPWLRVEIERRGASFRFWGEGGRYCRHEAVAEGTATVSCLMPCSGLYHDT
jgi:hypothetical protein